MKTFACSVILLLLVGQLAVAANLTVYEKLTTVPQGWKQLQPVEPSKRLVLRVALKQENAAAFEQHVIDISTPGHAKYGEHMSYDEVKRRVQPAAGAANAVLGWLYSQGVKSVKTEGDWITFAVTASQAGKLLDTEFHYYYNEVNGMEAIRTLQYSIPEDITKYVQMIQPTIRFGQFSAHRSTAFKIGDSMSLAQAKAKQGLHRPKYSSLNSTFCNTTITPECLRELYQIGNYTADASSGAKLGILGYLQQYAKYSDFSKFLSTYAPQLDSEVNNFTYALVNGGLDRQDYVIANDVEANLDVQYAIAMAANVKSTFYSVGGLGPLIPDLDQPDANASSNEPYLDFLHHILALPDSDLPTTLTTSYGEDEQSVPASYTNATCSLFAQLGARGVSILFSSGDTGPGSACQTNDGLNTTRFLPIFPAACPFVTSVGGTYHVLPERAIAFSSGGFSDRFPRPEWQDAAVSGYLDILGDRWSGLYNPSGRGFPDVAAQSYNFSVVDDGVVIPVGGTSASAPSFAGIVSLLNSARLAKGLKPLGFLNPWIYGAGKRGLTDIVDGGSRGCTGVDIYSGLPTPKVAYAGWNATEGWDPVTGWGTPIFPKLLQLALKV